MDSENVIPNDIEIGESFKCLIISGANTGGKTVLLKTIGLCSLMTLYGLHIPASVDSEIGVFTKIMADIGDDQNLSQSLSTFSGQLKAINTMFKDADKESIVIIDEIIVGTNPRQGAALAQSILEDLINKESIIIVTTHYTELKELASKDNRFQNASVSFNLESLKPDYKLHIGLPGLSYAIEIANTCKLPQSVLKRSRELLNSREITTEALIERMQLLEEERLKEQDQIHQLKDELEKEKNTIENEKQKIKRKIEEIKHKEGIEFLTQLKLFKKQVSERIHGLQNANLKEAGSLQDSILDIEDTISNTLEKGKQERFTDSYAKAEINTVHVGDWIFIPNFEKSGEIIAIDPDKEMVTILLGGSITIKHPVHELLIGKNFKTDKKKSKKSEKNQIKKVSENANSIIPTTIQTQYNTIDLRGKRVQEAIEELDKDLDTMSRKGIDSIVIIHGFGTGALKEAVRDHLKTSLYVRDFRKGEYGEGEDGVTIALLRD